MGGNTTAEKLRAASFFRGFSDEHLEKLAAISHEKSYNAHHAIFRENDPAKDVYFIVQGRVSLAICTPTLGCRRLMEAGAGEIIAWSPMLGRARLTDTATTSTPTEVIVFDGAALQKLCDEDHDLGYQFMRQTARVLAERLGATRAQLLNACGVELPEVVVETD